MARQDRQTDRQGLYAELLVTEIGCCRDCVTYLAVVSAEISIKQTSLRHMIIQDSCAILGKVWVRNGFS